MNCHLIRSSSCLVTKDSSSSSSSWTFGIHLLFSLHQPERQSFCGVEEAVVVVVVCSLSCPSFLSFVRDPEMKSGEQMMFKITGKTNEALRSGSAWNDRQSSSFIIWWCLNRHSSGKQRFLEFNLGRTRNKSRMFSRENGTLQLGVGCPVCFLFVLLSIQMILNTLATVSKSWVGEKIIIRRWWLNKGRKLAELRSGANRLHPVQSKRLTSPLHQV